MNLLPLKMHLGKESLSIANIDGKVEFTDNSILMLKIKGRVMDFSGNFQYNYLHIQRGH